MKKENVWGYVTNTVRYNINFCQGGLQKVRKQAVCNLKTDCLHFESSLFTDCNQSVFKIL